MDCTGSQSDMLVKRMDMLHTNLKFLALSVRRSLARLGNREC